MTEEHEKTDSPEPEAEAEAEVEVEVETEVETQEERPKHKPKERPERQAARYRVQRNQARIERDEARLELEFTRAAGGRFVDAHAAFKLADPSILSLDPDGTPVGIEEAIEALAEANPFLLTPDEEPPKKETDPFATASGRSSGRVMNGKRKTTLNTDLSRAALEAKYPALKR